MMQSSFVLARPADLELLVQLVRRLRECDPDEGRFDEAAARDAIPALVADPSVGRIWLINDGERTVGYVVLTLCYSIEFGGRIAFVDELFIEASHRRHGIGSQTLAFIEEKTAALGVRTLLLEVTKSNDAAKSLYRKQGFANRPHQLMTKRIG